VTIPGPSAEVMWATISMALTIAAGHRPAIGAAASYVRGVSIS
jgi:hypothetical protein